MFELSSPFSTLNINQAWANLAESRVCSSEWLGGSNQLINLMFGLGFKNSQILLPWSNFLQILTCHDPNNLPNVIEVMNYPC
jgi:hypothetical protein